MATISRPVEWFQTEGFNCAAVGCCYDEVFREDSAYAVLPVACTSSRRISDSESDSRLFWMQCIGTNPIGVQTPTKIALWGLLWVGPHKMFENLHQEQLCKAIKRSKSPSAEALPWNPRGGGGLQRFPRPAG